MTMTLINLLRRRIGLMPSGYSFYKIRDLYLLTFKGYRAGIAASSHRQLREQAWEHFRAQMPEVKNQRLPVKGIVSDQVPKNRTAGHKVREIGPCLNLSLPEQRSWKKDLPHSGLKAYHVPISGNYMG
jgi:hypothetical protein